MGVILGLLVFAGACLLLVKLIDISQEKKLGKEGWAEFQKSLHQDKQNKKFNNYLFTCPMCGSKKVSKLSDLNRAGSIALKGLASDKIGKQYECNDCNHKW